MSPSFSRNFKHPISVTLEQCGKAIKIHPICKIKIILQNILRRLFRNKTEKGKITLHNGQLANVSFLPVIIKTLTPNSRSSGKIMQMGTSKMYLLENIMKKNHFTNRDADGEILLKCTVRYR
jgi:hypothetical protein